MRLDCCEYPGLFILGLHSQVMTITLILNTLKWFAAAALAIYLIIWILRKLHIILPQNVVRAIWAILVVLTLIWIIDYSMVQDYI